MRSGWRPGARRHRSPPIAAVLFKAVQFGVLAIFIWYGFDLRRKHGMTPLALPWLTRVMKVVSCVVVVLYVYVLWAVHELVWTDVLALVFTTLGADADATAFAQTLVEERLAACVNVLPPMISMYRWKGGVEQDREQQLIIKTTVASLGRLQARVRELHPYEVPEFLVIPAIGGSDAYLTWVQDSVG